MTKSELQVLAPPKLKQVHRNRYRGTDERKNLGFFAPEDRQYLIQIYGGLLALLRGLESCREAKIDWHDFLHEFVEGPHYSDLIEAGAKLGHASLSRSSNPHMKRILHDLRGGAFQALSFRLQLFSIAPSETKGLRSIYFFARDQLKIMRHCVKDLDPDRFKMDSGHRYHDTQLLVEKWQEAELPGGDRPMQVSVDCSYDGTLCRSCLEMCSLDRVIYNLMNNAARHSSDGQIYLYIVPVPVQETENVRFVVVNKIATEHRDLLSTHFPDDLSGIFEGNFMPDEGGLGIRICADFCARAYGVYDFEKARTEGYFGARGVGDYFAAWFHWPIVVRKA